MDRERAAIDGAPEKLEIWSDRVSLFLGKRLGVEEEKSRDEWNISWRRRKWVIQAFMVFLGDLEPGHYSTWEQN